MAETKVKTGDSFTNGFDYFCTNCGHFFSARIMDGFGNEGEVSFCPRCGEDDLITTAKDFCLYCCHNGTDPINFYRAFPPDEQIDGSCVGATPREVEWIVSSVISDREKKIPVTVESIAESLGYDEETVAAVFEELHL